MNFLGSDKRFSTLIALMRALDVPFEKLFDIKADKQDRTKLDIIFPFALQFSGGIILP